MRGEKICGVRTVSRCRVCVRQSQEKRGFFPFLCSVPTGFLPLFLLPYRFTLTPHPAKLMTFFLPPFPPFSSSLHISLQKGREREKGKGLQYDYCSPFSFPEIRDSSFIISSFFSLFHPPSQTLSPSLLCTSFSSDGRRRGRNWLSLSLLPGSRGRKSPLLSLPSFSYFPNSPRIGRRRRRRRRRGEDYFHFNSSPAEDKFMQKDWVGRKGGERGTGGERPTSAKGEGREKGEKETELEGSWCI